MTDSPTPIDMIREKVLAAVIAGQEHTFNLLDRLNLTETQVVTALRDLHEDELLDHYADWADIDLREPDEKIPDTPVPDPGNAPSYDTLNGADS